MTLRRRVGLVSTDSDSDVRRVLSCLDGLASVASRAELHEGHDTRSVAFKILDLFSRQFLPCLQSGN